MYRLVVGVLTLLLATPALGAADNPKDKSATPAKQYQALLKEYQDAAIAFQDAIKNAKTQEERQKIISEKDPRWTLAPKFVDLAEKNPKDPAAVDALIWVLTNNLGSLGEKGTTAKAMAILMRDHIESDKLGPLCESLDTDLAGFDKRIEAFLRLIIAKNPHKGVRTEACLMLARRLSTCAYLLKRMEEDPQFSKGMESSFGKDTVEELKKPDLAQQEAECEKVFREFADTYAGDMQTERLTRACQQIVFSQGKGEELLLRTLLENDVRHEVQGVACLSLAQLQKLRANAVPESEAKAAKAFLDESEKALERAVAKYADVKLPVRGTVGAKATSELYELRCLSVGKAAPEVAGKDQDGQNFKLSDYKGKVVLLDFWSEF
jgi:hypothetical protein